MAPVVVSGLRLQNNTVNILAVHPELRHISRTAFDTPELRAIPTLVVTSGARTRDEQVELRRKYEAGEGPLAARPDHEGPTGRVGSAHQIQIPKKYKHGLLDNTAPFAYAIDISPKNVPRSWNALRNAMESSGAVANLWHKDEFWHYVVRHDWRPQVITGHGMAGQTTLQIQKNFRRAGSAIKVDGQHGPATTRVVKDWQRKFGRTGIWVNGDWTRADHELFLDWLQDRRSRRAEAAAEQRAAEESQRAERERQVVEPATSADRQMLLKIQRDLNGFLS